MRTENIFTQSHTTIAAPLFYQSPDTNDIGKAKICISFQNDPLSKSITLLHLWLSKSDEEIRVCFNLFTSIDADKSFTLFVDKLTDRPKCKNQESYLFMRDASEDVRHIIMEKFLSFGLRDMKPSGFYYSCDKGL